jgi:hypothetical protein
MYVTYTARYTRVRLQRHACKLHARGGNRECRDAAERPRVQHLPEARPDRWGIGPFPR